MADPRLLVIGATGKIGGILRRSWQAAPPGFRAVWLSRRSPAPAGCESWDPASTAPLPPAGAVLVLAGVTDGDAAALDQNRAIALRVCEAAARAGARHLLFASSAAVYGSTGDRAAGESAVPRPQGAYGASKLEMERAVMAWRAAAGAQAPQVTVLRIGNVAGADAVTRLASRGGRQALDRFAGGDGPVRSYIGPRTLAAVIAALAVRALAGAPLPVVLNVASPGAVALAELMRASGIAFDWRPAPPAAIARVVLDTAALEALVPLAPADPAAMVAEARLLAGTPA